MAGFQLSINGRFWVSTEDQTDGEPRLSRARHQAISGGRTAALKNAILERGIVLEAVDDLEGALGTSSGGCIRLLNGPTPATEFTTLVHEYAHFVLRFVMFGACIRRPIVRLPVGCATR